jgi:hypothetical protein
MKYSTDPGTQRVCNNIVTIKIIFRLFKILSLLCMVGLFQKLLKFVAYGM